MNTLIEILAEGSIPLLAGALSCISSILLTFITGSIQKRKEKDKDANVKIKVNGQEMTIEGYSTEEVLELLSRLESKNQTQKQGEEDTAIEPKDQVLNQNEDDII